jgi:hypothetical protein
MSIPRGRVVPVACHLLGFAGEKVSHLGSIELLVTAGSYPRQKVIMVKIQIVDRASAYNAIFGRTALNELKAVTCHFNSAFEYEIPKH